MDSYGDNSALQDRRRNRAELTMSQNIGQNLGSLMLSAVREDYWNSGKTMESYSAGYNNARNSVTYGITYTYSKNGSTDSYGHTTSYDKDQRIALNVSVPLEKFCRAPGQLQHEPQQEQRYYAQRGSERFGTGEQCP